MLHYCINVNIFQLVGAKVVLNTVPKVVTEPVKLLSGSNHRYVNRLIDIDKTNDIQKIIYKDDTIVIGVDRLFDKY